MNVIVFLSTVDSAGTVLWVFIKALISWSTFSSPSFNFSIEAAGHPMGYEEEGGGSENLNQVITQEKEYLPHLTSSV